MMRMTAPLLGRVSLALLREAVDGYTVDAISDLLGPVGRAAHQRGDLVAVGRALPAGERLTTLIRLFLLGEAVPEPEARSALRPLDLAAAGELVEVSGDQARARLELRPYATDTSGPWWVVSDFGSDVRPGPLAPDHVLGIGAASLTLAQATPRHPVRRALDLGTGCGVQALHASAYASEVVATDVSTRALRLAATTAELSGYRWDLREGSLLEPVADESFDLIVANPPFVVSPGLDRDHGGYDYRDSGLAGDAASATLIRDTAHRLSADGSASLLANWIIPTDGDWAARLEGWLADAPCDAWVWQREVVGPDEYVALWLRDAGEVPGSRVWRERHAVWRDWFDAAGVAAIGMGLVTMWRTDGGPRSVVCEDVPQAVEQPAGAHLDGWLQRRRWLARRDDAALLAARLRRADGVVRSTDDLVVDGTWSAQRVQLRQLHAMRWELDSDDTVTGLVAACDGAVPLSLLVEVVAAVNDADADQVVRALLPVVRDLIGRGFLLPADSGHAA
jgi:methylase of polypeptide subunit release factors